MSEPNSINDQKLFKLLVAAAWIDGEVQAEEKAYLQRLASEKNLLEKPEIQSLLSHTSKIPSEKCYQWLQEYLGDNPTEETYHTLFAEIAGLVYCDGYIAAEEATLLNELQGLDPNSKNSRSMLNKVFSSIRKIYRLNN